MSAETAQPETPAPHEASLAVWDIAAAVAAGERCFVKIGAKSSAGCGLGGCRVEVRDGNAVLASGRLGETPWPGTTALYWTEIELRAPDSPGALTLAARFEGGDLDVPHQDASALFDVSVVARPSHSLAVSVTSGGAPIEEAYIRLGPYRATTDRAGQARVRLAKGRYELVVWKAGYDIDPVPLAIDADTAIDVEARPLPQNDPDAVWTA